MANISKVQVGSTTYNVKDSISGYTTNTGTCTSVAVKMNGAVKGTITTSGTIDLGTIITAHQTLKTINSNSIVGSGNITTADTKNTAGSTDTASKIFIIGATSQGANPQTYSQDTAYVGTDGCLYSGGTKVLTAHQTLKTINGTSIVGSGNLEVGGIEYEVVSTL